MFTLKPSWTQSAGFKSVQAEQFYIICHTVSTAKPLIKNKNKKKSQSQYKPLKKPKIKTA